MTIQTHQFDPPSGPLPSYLDRLNDLIKWAVEERAQVEKHGYTEQRNGWVQLAFVQAGVAICDDWKDWASELDQSLNGDG